MKVNLKFKISLRKEQKTEKAPYDRDFSFHVSLIIEFG